MTKTVTMMMKNMMMMMISTEEEMYGRSADGKEEFKLPTGSRPFVSCEHHIITIMIIIIVIIVTILSMIIVDINIIIALLTSLLFLMKQKLTCNPILE